MTAASPASTRSSQPFLAQRSHELHQEALKYLPGGTSRAVQDTKPHPLYARNGSGSVITDVDGNRRLDFYSNATSLIHGHAHPVITRAVIDRVSKGAVFSLASEEQIELARMIGERVASVEQVRFMNSGSEAVLLAMRVMRALTGRHKIARFEGAYHGNADWAEVSLTPDPSNWGSADAPASVAYTAGLPPGVLSDVVVLPFNDPARTDTLLERHQHELAGVLIDVIPAYFGLVPAQPGWLAHLREVTSRLGLLLVSDEVVSFRLGYGGAQADFGFAADLTIFGKIIGGGFPVGAVGGPSALMHVFDASKGRAIVPHAGTFNANPVTMTAGISSLSLLTREEFTRLNRLGAVLRERLTAAFEAAGVPAHVKGAGSLFRIHMTDARFADYRGYWHAVQGNAEVKKRQHDLYIGLLGRGVLLSPSGLGALSTPMTEREVDTFVDAVQDTIEGIGVGTRRSG